MSPRVELPAFDIDMPATPELLVSQYDDYRAQRDILQALELRGEPADDALAATYEAKERIAYTALALYAQTESVSEFEVLIREAIGSSVGAQEDALRMGTDDALLGAYIHPLSLVSDRSASPIESILVTCRNLAVADRFAEVAEATASGMLLSGSTAWGGFYAVHGGVPPELQAVGVAQLEWSSMSDVDLVVTAPTDEALGATVAQMAAEGLIEMSEVDRFEKYLELREAGEADLFSVRSFYGGVQESLHFIPDSTLRYILEQIPHRQLEVAEGHVISTVNDFRPNFPGSVIKDGGYALGDLRDMVSLLQPAQVSPVTADGRSLGYISRSPVGGPTLVDGNPTYLMGIMTFLTNIRPIFLLDSDGTLVQRVAQSQRNIASMLGGEHAVNVIRRQQMPKRVLQAVLDSLS